MREELNWEVPEFLPQLTKKLRQQYPPLTENERTEFEALQERFGLHQAKIPDHVKQEMDQEIDRQSNQQSNQKTNQKSNQKSNQKPNQKSSGNPSQAPYKFRPRRK